MLEMSLLGVGTVLRLERDAWLTVNCLRQATNEYAPPPPSLGRFSTLTHLLDNGEGVRVQVCVYGKKSRRDLPNTAVFVCAPLRNPFIEQCSFSYEEKPLIFQVLCPTSDP